MVAELWKSEKISSRYDYVERLGKGGFGSVFKAKDKSLDKFVAIKAVSEELSPEEAMRFQQEAKLAGKLKHANIVSTLDFGVTESNRPYLVLEYLNGQSLEEMVKEEPLELHDALYIFIQICRGMSHSHTSGILHRDLKPSNVIVGKDEDGHRFIKIVDFGLAKHKDVDVQLTRSGVSVGTPYYSSPEQSEGRRDDIDERSDVYSMGCLMYKCLTGSAPFEGETALETLILQKSEIPDSLSERSGVEYPESLEDLVRRAISVNPSDRLESFDALATELKRISDGCALLFECPATAESADSAPTDTAQLRRFLIKGALVAAVVVIGLGVLCFSVQKVLDPPKQDKLELGTEDRTWLDQFTVQEDSNGWVEIGCPMDPINRLGELKRYKRIKLLEMSETSMTGEELSALSESWIRDVNLNDCPVTEAGIKQLAKVKGLERLEIMSADVSNASDAALVPLASSPHLKALHYASRKMTEKSFEYIKTSSSIMLIKPGSMSISARGIESLLSMPNLGAIFFANCKISDQAYERLRKPSQIYCAGLVTSNVSAHDLEQLMSLPMRQLRLYHCLVEPDVLMKVKGDQRFVELIVTSPGISKNMQEEIAASLSKRCACDISTGNPVADENDIKVRRPY